MSTYRTPTPRLTSLLGATFLLLVLLVPVLSAEIRVLSADGRLASLEPGDTELILAVGDETVPVPGTAGASDSAMELIASGNGNLTAIWLSNDGESSQLRTATYDGAQWSGLASLQAGDEALRFSSPPEIVVRHDRLSINLEEDNRLETERQIAYVVWREDDGRIRFSPLIYQDGRYLGWNEIVTVSSAFRAAHQGDSANGFPSGDASSLLALAATADGTSLQLTLLDSVTGRIGTMWVDVVPLLIEIFGDAIFQQILDLADLYDPSDTSLLADEMGGQIIHIGARLNLDPNVSGFMSERVASWLEESGSDFGWDLNSLADASRSTILDLGRSVYSVSVPNDAGDGETVVLDIGDFLDSSGHREEFARLMRLRMTGDFSAPAEARGDSVVHVSKDGSSLALSWVDTGSGTVHWVENSGSGWTETKSLTSSDSLDTEAIRSLIAASIR